MESDPEDTLQSIQFSTDNINQSSTDGVYVASNELNHIQYINILANHY